MVGQAESLEVVNYVYNKVFPQFYQQSLPMVSVSNNGLLTFTSDNKIVMGFGILCELTPTYDILSSVATWNQTNRVGHYWLAEGSDDEHWSLVCGFKYLLNWESAPTLAIKLENVAEAYDTLLDANVSRAKNFGGSPYWTPSNDSESEINSCALVLVSHLV